MRIHFPNAEHVDVAVDSGRVLVGSAVSGDDAIQIAGLAPQHAAIEVDRIRGIWLNVVDGQDVIVNGRPVRERAHLRLGDHLVLGRLQLQVRADTNHRETPPEADPLETLRPPAGRASLRAVAGSYFGKMIALEGRTVIGRERGCDVVLDEPGMPDQHSVIENVPEGLYLREIGAGHGAQVNGIPVSSTVLQPGDQLAFAQNRFLVEAPGWQPIARTPTAAVPVPPRANSTQVQRRLVPPPGSPGAPKAAGAGPSPAELRRTSQVTNWILAIAALVTLVALGTVIFLSVNNSL